MCPLCQNPTAKVTKCGFFRKQATRAERIQRFHCHSCGRRFSTQTGTLTYRERKPHVDQVLARALNEGVSQRGCARILGIHRKTVARKLRRLGTKAAQNNATAVSRGDCLPTVTFDEMETFEHSKCKPLAIVVAVEEGTRRIISARVASMPAKGRLAAIARRRYGIRHDGRRAAILRALADAARAAPGLTLIRSDRCPRYPGLVRRALPGVRHDRFLSRRGCVVGQGELKRGGFDPLFSLNHTCAMFRDRLKTLTRRTWCTTKRPHNLQHLVDLYTWSHNEVLRLGPHHVTV